MKTRSVASFLKQVSGSRKEEDVQRAIIHALTAFGYVVLQTSEHRGPATARAATGARRRSRNGGAMNSSNTPRRTLRPEDATGLLAEALNFWTSNHIRPTVVRLNALNGAGIEVEPQTPAVLRVRLRGGQSFIVVVVADELPAPLAESSDAGSELSSSNAENGDASSSVAASLGVADDQS